MRRLLLAAAVIGALALVAWRVAEALTSDETRIQRRLDAMAEGFGKTRLRPIASGLATDFLDEASGYDRAIVLDLLRSLFFEHVQGRFPYSVELPRNGMTVEFTGDDEAEVKLVAQFSERVGEEWQPAWAVEIDATMVREGGDWRVRRTVRRTIEGDEGFLR